MKQRLIKKADINISKNEIENSAQRFIDEYLNDEQFISRFSKEVERASDSALSKLIDVLDEYVYSDMCSEFEKTYSASSDDVEYAMDSSIFSDVIHENIGEIRKKLAEKISNYILVAE